MMKNDRVLILTLCIIAALLFVNLMRGFLPEKPDAVAQEQKMRYTISSWGAELGTGYCAYGYYVVDQVSGEIVDSKVELHKAPFVPKSEHY